MAPHLSIFTALPDALPVLGMDINPYVTNLEHTTKAPGGYETLRCGFPDPQRPGWGFLPQAVNVKGFYHLVLEDGGFLCCEGRLVKPPLTGGEVRSLEATGYGICGLTDDWYENTSTVAISQLDLIKDVLSRSAPLLTLTTDPDRAVDSGITYVPNDLYGQPPSTIIDRLKTVGTGSSSAASQNAPYDWLVYEGRIATWIPRLAPLRVEDLPAGTFGPKYQIDFDPVDVDWDPDFTDTVSDATVFYTPPGGSASQVTVSDPSVTDRWGIVRRAPIQAGTGYTDAEAQQAAQTYLALHNQPLISVTVRREQARGLRLAGGGEYPPQCVRAGEWLQVGDQQPVYIVSTTYNWPQQKFEAQCTWYPPGYWTQLGMLEQMIVAFQQGLNPNSGVKA